jgi:hypothetical protein
MNVNNISINTNQPADHLQLPTNHLQLPTKRKQSSVSMLLSELESDLKSKSEPKPRSELKLTSAKYPFGSYLNFDEFSAEIVIFKNSRYKVFRLKDLKYADINVTNQEGARAQIIRVLVIQELTTQALIKTDGGISFDAPAVKELRDQFLSSRVILLKEDNSWIRTKPVFSMMENYFCDTLGVLKGNKICLLRNKQNPFTLMQKELYLHVNQELGDSKDDRELEEQEEAFDDLNGIPEGSVDPESFDQANTTSQSSAEVESSPIESNSVAKETPEVKSLFKKDSCCTIL